MSSNLCVFTTGTNLDLLRQSCSDVNITLHTFNVEHWKGYVHGKLREAVKFLQHRTEHYAMWVDGNDSLILRSAPYIVARLEALGAPVMIAAEKNCWPDATLAEKYPMPWSAVPREAKYINSGGIIGPTGLLLTYMHTVLHEAKTEDDQGEWTRTYLAGLLPELHIDRDRWIFASVGDGDEALKCNSCVKHWNGRVPGREEYYDRLKGQAGK